MCLCTRAGTLPAGRAARRQRPVRPAGTRAPVQLPGGQFRERHGRAAVPAVAGRAGGRRSGPPSGSTVRQRPAGARPPVPLQYRGGVVMIRPSRTPSAMRAAVSSQSRPAASGDSAGPGQPRVEALPEQQFGTVDVSDAGNHLLVHEQGRHGRALGRQRGGKRVPVRRGRLRSGSGPRRARTAAASAPVIASQVVAPRRSAQPCPLTSRTRTAPTGAGGPRSRRRRGSVAAPAVVVDLPLPHLAGRTDAGRAAEGGVPAEIPGPVEAQVDVQDQAVVEVAGRGASRGRSAAARTWPSSRAAPAANRPCGLETASRLARENVTELARQPVDGVPFRHYSTTSPVRS